jgi:hypothetical protein
MTNLKYITPEFYHRWLEDCPVKWERIDDDVLTQTIKFSLPIEEEVDTHLADNVEKCIIDGNDYRDCVDTLVENMGTNV